LISLKNVYIHDYINSRNILIFKNYLTKFIDNKFTPAASVQLYLGLIFLIGVINFARLKASIIAACYFGASFSSSCSGTKETPII
jgi:hypothetical protein